MRNIAEFCSEEIIKLIQSSIGQSLDVLSIDRPDGLVTLENPSLDSYFNYEHAIGYRTPSVFVVPTNIDFQLVKGANHINAKVNIFVSLILEDKNQALLQIKCFRYADAVTRILSNARLDGSQQSAIIKVTRISFSGSQPNKGTIDSEFRKEAMIELELDHYDLTK